MAKKKPTRLTGHAMIDLFECLPTDQLFAALADQYGFEATCLMFEMTLARNRRCGRSRTKPNGPHSIEEMLHLKKLWDLYSRKYPGESKQAFERWYRKTIDPEPHTQPGTIVRRLDRTLQHQ